MVRQRCAQVGYSDRVLQGLTNRGYVSVGGVAREVLGSISVNYVVVDLDGTAVLTGDVVTREGECILERQAGFMRYQFCVGLNALTPSVYVEGGLSMALSEPRIEELWLLRGFGDGFKS